jgi:hypothetical protein
MPQRLANHEITYAIINTYGVQPQEKTNTLKSIVHRAGQKERLDIFLVMT